MLNVNTPVVSVAMFPADVPGLSVPPFMVTAPLDAAVTATPPLTVTAPNQWQYSAELCLLASSVPLVTVVPPGIGAHTDEYPCARTGFDDRRGIRTAVVHDGACNFARSGRGALQLQCFGSGPSCSEIRSELEIISA